MGGVVYFKCRPLCVCIIIIDSQYSLIVCLCIMMMYACPADWAVCCSQKTALVCSVLCRRPQT